MEVKANDLYDEPRIQQYVNGGLSRWAAAEVTTEKRWLEMLLSLKEQQRPTPNFSLLAQYALAIPGTSAEVERLFSMIKGIWGPEKGQLKPETLEAHLDIKFNCKDSCSDFYHRVKADKKLLSQVKCREENKKAGGTPQ